MLIVMTMIGWSKTSDFCDFDEYFIEDVFDVNTKQIIGNNNVVDLGFPIEYMSNDSDRCNNYGPRLIELCKFTNLRIANGLCECDAYI